MAVFSRLGSTTSDIKTYIFAMWFLKARICDVTAAIPFLSVGPPAHLLNTLSRQPSSLHCFVMPHTWMILFHMRKMMTTMKICLLFRDNRNTHGETLPLQVQSPGWSGRTEHEAIFHGIQFFRSSHLRRLNPGIVLAAPFWKVVLIVVSIVFTGEAKWNKLRVRGDKTGNQGYSLIGEVDESFRKVIYSRKPAIPLKSTHWFCFCLSILHVTDVVPVCSKCVYSISPCIHPSIVLILMGKFTIHTILWQLNFSGTHLCWIHLCCICFLRTFF